MKSEEKLLENSGQEEIDLACYLLDQFVPGMERGVHWGLERIRKFLTNTGAPHLKYPVIHIGGTNGKGSVAASLTSVLSLQGYSVGLYTSPHLCSFNERIQIDGSCVKNETLKDLIIELGPEMNRCGLSFFEATTGLAFHMFQRSKVEIAIIEVGLGGRLDATNVVEPISTVITNIQMDHREYLGDTKEEIAFEKLGIVKEGIPLFTSETDKHLLEMFSRVCRERKSQLFPTFYENPVTQVEVSLQGTSFKSWYKSWGNLEIFTPLIGDHQAINTSLALAVMEQLPGPFLPKKEALIEGSSLVDWPGRIQVEKKSGVTWIFDIAHNQAGASALANTLNCLQLEGPTVVLVSVLVDKDWKGIFFELVNVADYVVLTQSISAPIDRRWDLSEVSTILDDSEVKVCPDFADALVMVETLAQTGTVVVTGSAHTVGDVLSTLDFDIQDD
jgi:dihydrofolate synthase/folylpolyglutamate synthase